MAEKDYIVDKLRINYEGLFSISDLYSLIDNWLRTKGYDKRETKNMEIVKPDGKFIELLLEPWKGLTDYAKSIIRLRIQMSDIKDVEIERDNTKIKMNQGKINLVFDGILVTDYENTWEGKPFYYFIRTLYDKYFYKPFTSGFQNGVREDVIHLHSEIKAFLNLNRFH